MQNNLRQLRGSIHQADFAASLGIPQLDGPMLSRIEKGIVNPTPEDAEIIAEKLGVKIGDIWPAEALSYAVHGQPPEKLVSAFANGQNGKNFASVTRHIPSGKQNAVSWTILSAKTGLRERHIRKMIEDARNDGEIILNYGTGYYYPDEPEDAVRYFYYVLKTATSYQKRLKPLRKLLSAYIPKQVELCLGCGEETTADFCDKCTAEMKCRRSAGTETTAIA